MLEKTPIVQTKPARWLRPRMLLLSALAAMVLAACGGTGSGSISRLKAAIGSEQPTNSQPAAQPAATALPLPTETPDLTGEVQAVIAAPQSVEVTREVVVTATPAPATSTPQPVQPIAPACDPMKPLPTIALDATDVAAGVVLRGQWCEE